MEKQVRVKIASRFPGVLPMNGLTRLEFAAKNRYESLPESVKAQMANRGKKRFSRNQTSSEKLTEHGFPL